MSALRFGKSWPAALLALAAIVAVAAAIAIPTAPSFGQSGASGPYRNFKFRVEIDGVDAGFFASVDGLSVEQEVVEFRSGDGSTIIRKLPGRVKYGDITLKRGYVSSGPLTAWVEASLTGPDADASGARRNGSIKLYDQEHSEVARFNFFEAWPSKWELSDLDTTGRDALIEEVTIVVERLERG